MRALGKLKLANLVFYLLCPLSLAVFYLAYHLPIYTDEIGALMLQDRYYLDQGKAIWLYAPCTASPPPEHFSLFVPVRAVQSFVYGQVSNPIFVRWLAIAKLLLWASLFLVIVRRVLAWRGGRGLRAAGALVIASLMVAILPLILVLNRPEQAMLIGITLISLLSLFPPRWLTRKSWLYALIVPATLTCMLTEHPKGIFFLPLFVASFWLLRMKSRYRALGACLTMAVAVLAVAHYSGSLDCDGDQVSRQRIQETSLLVNRAEIRRDPLTFLKRGFGNLFSTEYVVNVGFSDPYSNFWLPTSAEFPDIPLAGLNLEIALFYYLLIAFTLLSVARGIILLATRRLGPREKRILVIAVSLTAGLCALMFTENQKNFYASGLVIPAWVLAFFLSLGLWRMPRSRRDRLISLGLVAAAALCFVTQLAVFQRFGPSLQGSWSKGGDIPEQDYSFSAVSFGAVKQEMESFFQSCGLYPSAGLRHLVVDDMTYSTLRHSREPYHLMYLTRYWGAGIPSLHKFLLERGSDGIGVRCRFLDTPRDRALLELADRGGTNNSLCCIPRGRLEKGRR